MPNPEQRIRELLIFLYGPSRADEIWPQLENKLAAFRAKVPARRQSPAQETPWSERDAILITYADQFSTPGQTPLQTLSDFLEKYLGDAISGVHLLPFYPYSSDDGFSVVNYRDVDPRMGTWEDIPPLRENYRLMFDAVINHISRQSAWFQGYLRGEEPFTDYFIEVPPEIDLSGVTRPRALPLLTPVETSRGVRDIWTTFSDDQIDLNYANPQVLLEIIDLLLFYVSQGAEFIRLDAIAYLWKEIGSPCIHLPQTHAVVKMWRAVLDRVAPEVIL
ncbi:MAG TPA: alpha-amylase family glycosyl hydrolase, partial [Anaerolineales bacterium]|nr:alpha-amylase family glycosyl hydrolase [Anaerolineales bacterium]